MKLSEALGSRHITDGDLYAVRAILEKESVVDIAGCIYTKKIAEKLACAPNVTDSEDEAVRRIIEDNISLPKLLAENPPVKLPTLFRPIDKWLSSLTPGVIYDCSQNYQQGILVQIAKPAVALTFNYATKYAFGLISQHLYVGNDITDILSGSEYVLVPSANAFYKYRYSIKDGRLMVERNSTYKVPSGIVEAKIVPGYFGETQLHKNKYWEPVIKACLAASELVGVKKTTLYSFLTDGIHGQSEMPQE